MAVPQKTAGDGLTNTGVVRIVGIFEFYNPTLRGQSAMNPKSPRIPLAKSSFRLFRRHLVLENQHKWHDRVDEKEGSDGV
jgi:hypothetical protein